MPDDFAPPRPLSIAARQTWQRHADRLYRAGRWRLIDHDMLALYCETEEQYLKFKADVDQYGTLVQGRSLQERVRNPSIMGMATCRADLMRLARAVPLVTVTEADEAGAEMDEFIALMGNQ